MTIPTPHPHLAPLLRMLSMPPALLRFAPASQECKLHTVLLRDSPLARGHEARFDDSCRLTVPEGELDAVCRHVKLALSGPSRAFKGVHLALLAVKGSLAITLQGDDVRVFLGRNTTVFGTATLATQSALFIGDDSTMAHVRLVAAHADLHIGSDCQVLGDALIESVPSCPMVDFATGEKLNPGRPKVQIGRHVLIGRRAMVLAGARIGDGCVIDAGAVVDSVLPPACLAAGVPARVQREHVGWARQGQVPPDLKDSGVPSNLPTPDDET